MSPRTTFDQSISAQYSKKAENTSPPTTDQKNFTKSLLMAKNGREALFLQAKLLLRPKNHFNLGT